MQSRLESDRSTLRTNLITIDRPDSSQLVDLHIYIIPKTVWKNHQNLAENEAIEQAISAGFVRVSPNLTIQDLRPHIVDICGQEDEFPKEFIYLRSVGRCLAKVKPHQETDLRVKNYRPPITIAPEIYVLEGHYDDDSLIGSNSRSYLSRETPIQRPSATPPQVTTSHQQGWIKSMAESPQPLTTIYSSIVHSGKRQNSTTLNGSRVASSSDLSRASSTLSARDLAKLREEQERLRLRQIELARQRHEIEQQQEKRGLEHEEQSSESEHEEQPRKIEPEQQKHVIDQEKQKHEMEKELQRREMEHAEQKRRIEHEAERLKIEQEQQRRKTEQEEQTRQRELLAKQENLSKKRKEDEAAVRIQKTYRGYRVRRKIKEQKQREDDDDAAQIMQRTYRIQIYDNGDILDAHEIERLQKEARELTRRKAEEEHAEEIKAHDVVRLSNRFEEIKTKRVELEATREAIIRRMQQLHAQIAVRRTEERDSWKQKYLNEKKNTVALEEKIRTASKGQPDINSQLEQTKIRLNNSTKLRQQAENECHLLKQELQQTQLSMNTLGKHSLPKRLPPSQQQQQTAPISSDRKLQY